MDNHVEKNRTWGGIHEVLNILPHRFPMLLVDRFYDLVPGKSANGIKAVTYNEPMFEGHLPENPIMPGVYIIECLMQLINLVVMSENKDVDVFYSKISKSKFYGKVLPGCLLNLSVTIKGSVDNMQSFDVVAEAEGNKIFSGEISILIVSKY